MSHDPERPYQALPPLPPAAALETVRVLKALTSARASLAALDQACQLLPNPTVLINALPLLEAQASSEIENIVTTTDELFKSVGLPESQTSAATKETLRYRSALKHGFDHVARRPLTADLARDLCSVIKGIDMDFRAEPGTRIANPTTGKVIYTPPEGRENIVEKLGCWERFYHGPTSLDPLVVMAACHYQFEAIHPFHDGNGRTGRLLNILMLVEKGLLTLPVLYLSRYIIENKSDYYRLLGAVTRDGAWEEWILYMVEGVDSTARSTLRKIHDIRAMIEETSRMIREEAPKVYRHELVEILFTQPYSRISTYTDQGLAQRQTVSAWMSRLVDLGIVQTHKAGRDKIFINTRFLRLLAS